MGYALEGFLEDVGGSLVSGAASEIKTGMVAAVREVLPSVKTALSDALATGAQEIGKRNQTMFVILGVGLGVTILGSLSLMYFQYRRLGRCCPVR